MTRYRVIVQPAGYYSESYCISSHRWKWTAILASWWYFTSPEFVDSFIIEDYVPDPQ